MLMMMIYICIYSVRFGARLRHRVLCHACIHAWPTSGVFVSPSHSFRTFSKRRSVYKSTLMLTNFVLVVAEFMFRK